MRFRIPLLTFLSLLAILGAATAQAAAAPAKPVIGDVSVPDSVMVGQPINVSVSLGSSLEIAMAGKDVFIHYSINEGSTVFSKELIYNSTSGNWTGAVYLPAYINYTSTVEWLDIQVGAPENSTAINNKVTDVLIREESGGPWEMVLIVVFLGGAMVIIEILFRPIRRRPVKDVEEPEEEPDPAAESEIPASAAEETPPG